MQKLKSIILAMLVVLQLLLSGCFWLFVGGAAAVGGYAISSDSIQGEKDTSFSKMWQAAYRVAKILGSVKSEDKTRGEIRLEVNKAEVKITIEQLTPKAVRLRVNARKYLMPDIKLAQKIFIKIINELGR